MRSFPDLTDIVPAGTLPSPEHALLNGCQHLAQVKGFDDLAARLAGFESGSADSDSKALIQQIHRIAHQSGIQAMVRQENPERLAQLATVLPALVELRQGRFTLLLALHRDQAGQQIEAVTIGHVAAEGQLQEQRLQLAEFLRQWTGALLLLQAINTALLCFSIIAREHKIELTQERLVHEYGLGREEVPRDTLIRMAKDNQMRARLTRLDWPALLRLGRAFPVMVRLRNGCHVVLAGVVRANSADQEPLLALYDPLLGGHLRLGQAQFLEIYDGEVYLFKRLYRLTDQAQPFGLRWFMPEILRQKLTFVDIALAVLFINCIALVTPIFMQIVIDKVLVNQAITTLHVLGIALTVCLGVNAALEFVRDYLLLHATNKIDLRVTARTFRHMLNLPLAFYEHIAAGVLTQHMQQTSKIRNFLTGNVFLTMLEATSLFIFLPFLCMYSLKLTGIVVLFTSLIALVILTLMGPFKRRLNSLYDAEGRRQAMLVETINGMATVKAMAIEPSLRQQWENKVAAAVSMQFRVGKISITAKSLTQFLERAMTIVLIWIGASFVFDGSLSIGSLIAFQMLAGRVVSPLVRLVGLVHQYQEASLSVEKLGLVMNAKPEWGADRHGARPSLAGDIVFDRVCFRYAPDQNDVLKELSLTIPAGSSLGVVGPSGSGKTTFTRLLQKSYFPTAGTIRISDCYLNELDTAHLRRNMGVVLQESFLFHGTVADNIRAGQSTASRQEIIHAALQAGADEFVVKLPQGYDTILEEGAKNLSGGQRQRLAIARALLTRPQILILDEATSALDPESEQIIRENLKEIAQGRTTIMVSHRLSMLQHADAIIVLEDGRLIGHGTHGALLQSCPLYARLWKQQMELV